MHSLPSFLNVIRTLSPQFTMLAGHGASLTGFELTVPSTSNLYPVQSKTHASSHLSATLLKK